MWGPAIYPHKRSFGNCRRLSQGTTRKKDKEYAVSSAASVSVTASTQLDKEVMIARIAVMKVNQLKSELKKLI